MKSKAEIIRSKVNIQPVFRLVDLFEESTEYERNWKLPFNSISLCVRENPADPSWIELPEKRIRMHCQKNAVHFTTCETPMRIRYTTDNRHCCIHFRYELIPGVDLFSGIHERYVLEDRTLPCKIMRVFSVPDPLRRLALAESVAMEVILNYWPKHLPLDLSRMADFEGVFRFVNANLNSRISVTDMAAKMGWSDSYFTRTFRSVFHITPKQYLTRELFARAISLLNDSEKSVKEIAAELMFSSEFNFSRFIKHYSGQTPTDLRKSAKGPLYVRK